MSRILGRNSSYRRVVSLSLECGSTVDTFLTVDGVTLDTSEILLSLNFLICKWELKYSLVSFRFAVKIYIKQYVGKHFGK